jgi:hypothetical protein
MQFNQEERNYLATKCNGAFETEIPHSCPEGRIRDMVIEARAKIIGMKPSGRTTPEPLLRNDEVVSTLSALTAL